MGLKQINVKLRLFIDSLKELFGMKIYSPERNEELIEETWGGFHSSDDFCETCKFRGEDSNFLRNCRKYHIPTYFMKITNCVSYEEDKDG